MNMVKHIFKKDARRLRLPLAGWIITLALGVGISAVDATVVAGDFALQSTVQVIQSVVSIVQLILMILIVPMLIQDEPLSGTTAFWQTRPLRKNELMKSKFLFIGLFLILLPTLVKLTMLAANHVPTQYLLLAFPEILVKTTALVLVFTTLAVLTRSFVHYALTVGAVFIAKMALDAGIFIARQFGAFPNLQKLTSISGQNENVVVLVVILLSLATIIHQVATRKTLRSNLLLGFQILLVAYLQSFQPFELKRSANPTPHLSQVELENLSATRDRMFSIYIHDEAGMRPGDPGKKFITGRIDFTGMPKNCFGSYNGCDATLDVGGEHFEFKNLAVGAFPMISAAARSALAQTIAPLEMVADNRFGTRSTYVLMCMDALDYETHRAKTGIYTANFGVNVFQHKIVETLPLEEGAAFSTDASRGVVDAILPETHGCRIMVREQTIRPSLAVPKIQAGREPFIYLLVNRKEGTAYPVLSDRNPVFRMQRKQLFSSKLKMLRFSVPEAVSALYQIDKAWLKNAELMIVEPQWMAEKTVTMVEENFQFQRRTYYVASSFDQKDTDLSRIILPEKASRKEVFQYIQKINAFSSSGTGAYILSKDDPRIALYAAVGTEHLDLLITKSMGKNSYFSMRAIERLLKPEHKDLILKNLALRKELITLVIKYEWIDDARQILVDGVRQRENIFLPIEWVNLVASFNDPSTYSGLTDYFIHGANRRMTYGAIRNLPGIELDDAVSKAWKKSKYADVFQSVNIIPIALEYGHTDALGKAVSLLDSNDPFQTSLSMRKNIEKFTGQTGSNEALREWYRTNKDRLRFDAETKRFVVE